MGEEMEFLRTYAQTDAGLVDDSRTVRQGDVFVARRGSEHDGCVHIDEALSKGAAAVLHEAKASWQRQWDVPHCGIEGLADRLGDIADSFHGSPSSRLEVVAVTGTKGKTTTAMWCAQLLGASDLPCGYVGTLGVGVVGGDLRKTGLTTPGAVELHGLLAEFVALGCHAAVIEASSHGLAQRRLARVDCDVAVFTNLGSDHLDYHGSAKDYLKAKASLFARPGLDSAVVNSDDSSADSIIASASTEDVVRCGRDERCDLRWSVHRSGDGVAKARFEHDDDAIECVMPVPGAHNVANLCLAIAVARKSGMDWHEIAEAVKAIKGLPGRMERIGRGKIHAYVDFAHTPEALEATLAALREEHPGARLTCVFGCGGNRDRKKRPMMGEVAARLADRVIVTSDNPRDEDPGEIAREVLAGARDRAEIIVDRGEAIASAVAKAKEGEVLLVAGKGDETKIVASGGRECPFSDQERISAEMGGK